MLPRLSAGSNLLASRVPRAAVVAAFLGCITACGARGGDLETSSLEARIAKFPLTIQFASKVQSVAELGGREGYDVLPGYPFETNYAENEKLILKNERLAGAIRSAGLSIADYIVGMWALASHCSLQTEAAAGDVPESVRTKNLSFCRNNQELVASILHGEK